MTDPAEAKAPEGETEYENMKDVKESAAANNDVTVDVGTEDVDPDDSKAHLISANGGAGGGDTDLDVKIVDGTATSSEAEVSFAGLGKDEVMKYADEPFWKKLRLILFILFWVGWFAMLVTAIIIIVMAPRCPPRPDLKWYQTDTVYQVLPESFKDSDGDGKGDFKGLKDKQDLIFDDLGTKAMWLTSMYETDGMDSGRGIVNHKAVADWFGASVDDLKSWMRSLKKEEKRIILDLIPNQTSKKHPWFTASQKKDGKYKDYYVWAPNTNNSAPNNWQSVYGGPAWTLDSQRNEWYLHQFSKDHPDLDLLNPDVMNEIEEIMKFWLSAGVSGFNVRDVEYLVENPSLQDNDLALSQTRNYNGTLDILERMRKVVDSYSDKPGQERVLFATVQNVYGDAAKAYWGPKTKKRLHIVATVLEALNESTKATDIASVLQMWLTDDSNQWLGCAMGSPDVSRIANRMNSLEGLTIAHALQMLLPGTPFNYYGDEFGQRDSTQTLSTPVDKRGRDKYRSPMQWSSNENAGFTEGNPYLPIGTDYATNHFEAGSALFSDILPLNNFKDLVELRGEKESLQFGKTKMCAPDENLLLFTREAYRFPYLLVMINMGDSTKTVKLKTLDCIDSKENGKVVLHSRGELVDEMLDFHEHAVALEKGDVVVVEFSSDD